MKKSIGLVFVLITVVVFSFQGAEAGPAPLGTDPAAGPGYGYEALPLAARYAVSAAIGRDRQAYHFTENTEGLRGNNPDQSYEMGFSDKAVEIGAEGRQWGLSLSGWGYGADRHPVEPAKPVATGNRVEYRREALTEWYVNGPFGLQQGFTLESKPSVGRPGEELRLSLNLVGGLTARVDKDRRGVSLCGTDGAAVYRYAGLTVLDAEGREAQAWLEVEGDGLAIVVDDRDLCYPLMIDPLIQKAKLTASDGAGNDQFGNSVSISGDTVVVGASCDDSSRGSAYVFVKPSGGWATTSTFAAKLTASDGVALDYFGDAVSVSGDTVVVGAPYNSSQGSAYVFVKPPGGWATTSTFAAKLTASDGAFDDYFGGSVSVSGETVVVGASGDTYGSAYVFVKPGADWADMTQTAKLTASDGAASDYFGVSVSISGDTVVVGANGDDDNGDTSGSAYVFVKPGADWADMTQTAKLTASDGAAGDYFGDAVSISGDTVVVGAPCDDDNGGDSGSAYVFVKPSGGWSNMTQTAKLTASDGAEGDYFGISVSISGNTVVVGANGDDDNGSTSGSACVFVKPSGGWSNMTQTAILTASDAAAGDYFGDAVSVSGGTVVVGAPDDDSIQGSAYVFDPKRNTGLGPLGLLLLD